MSTEDLLDSVDFEQWFKEQPQLDAISRTLSAKRKNELQPAYLTSDRVIFKRLVKKYFQQERRKHKELKEWDQLLDAYRLYIEDNLERIARGGWTPLRSAEFWDSEECANYMKENK
jgi:predicted RNase H-like nuclease